MLLLEHGTAHFWGFPKGHIEPGESHLQTAVRELKEEINLDIVQFLCEEPIESRYTFQKQGNLVDKTVYYFPAVVAGSLQIQESEIGGAKWVPHENVLNLLTYDADRIVFKAISQVVADQGIGV